MVRLRDDSLRPICRIDWNVFRAVSLTLMVAFLVPWPFVHGGTMEMPIASHATPLPGAAKEDALLVAVTRDGRIFFGGDRVEPARLSERLRSSFARGAEKHVYILADKRARYGAVADAYDAVRASGTERVSFITFMPRTIRDWHY